jgi:hypothetical protein
MRCGARRIALPTGMRLHGERYASLTRSGGAAWRRTQVKVATLARALQEREQVEIGPLTTTPRMTRCRRRCCFTCSALWIETGVLTDLATLLWFRTRRLPWQRSPSRALHLVTRVDVALGAAQVCGDIGMVGSKTGAAEEQGADYAGAWPQSISVEEELDALYKQLNEQVSWRAPANPPSICVRLPS